MLRVVLALLSFPLAVLGILALFSHALAHSTEVIAFNEMAGIGPFGIFAAFLLLCAIAIPALVLAMSLGRLSLPVAASVGSIAGLLAVGTPALRQLLDPRLHLQYGLQQVLNAYPFVLVGVVACVGFWLVAVWRNPRVASLRSSALQGFSNVA